MRIRTLSSALFIVLLAPVGVQAVTTSKVLRVQPQSRLWLEGTSTVQRFECRAPRFDADVQARPDAAAAVLKGGKAVETVTVTVAAAALDCGNATMNEHMLKAVRAKEHPTIEFRLTSYELTPAQAGTGIRMNGRLTLGGTERPITLRAEATGSADGGLRVVGVHDVRMTEFGLKPPSLMMGTMKVGDVVKVRYDLHLKP